MKAIILGLILLSIAHAEFNVTNSTCTSSPDLLTTLNNLPGCITESVLGTFTSGFAYSIDQFLSASFTLIAATPDLHWFCTPYNNIMSIIESLYSLAFIALGFYYVFRSTDIEGRLAAKEWLKNLVMMIAILSFSFELFDILVSLNSYLTLSFLQYASQDVFSPSIAFTSLVFAFFVLSTSSFIVWLAFMTILAHYLLTPFLLLLFPISIFLYFMPFTKEWGTVFLKLIVSVVFMSAIDALLIMSLSILFSSPDPNLANSLIRGMTIILGFSLIGVLNLFIFLAAVFSIIGTATSSLGPIRYLIAGLIGRLI